MVPRVHPLVTATASSLIRSFWGNTAGLVETASVEVIRDDMDLGFRLSGVGFRV